MLLLCAFIGLLLGLKHLYGSMDAGAAGIIVKATLSMFIEVRDIVFMHKQL